MFYFSKLKTKIMFVTGTVALFIILKHIIVIIKVIKVAGTSTIYLSIFKWSHRLILYFKNVSITIIF